MACINEGINMRFSHLARIRFVSGCSFVIVDDIGLIALNIVITPPQSGGLDGCEQP